MATSLILDDYVLKKRSTLLFTAENFEALYEEWSTPIEYLTCLDNIEIFKGRAQWDQLDPFHFRALITNTLNTRDKTVTEGQLFNDKLPIVRTLYMLLMGLIYCIQVRTAAAVDTLRVTRVSEVDVAFEFTLSMIPENKAPKPKTGLQVVVDNT